jgi:hypothetical protein
MQNLPIPSIRHILTALAAASLVACAAPPAGEGHARHHPGQAENATVPPASAASGAQGGGMTGGAMMGSAGNCPMMGSGQPAGACNMQQMNKEQMCAMYRSMRDAPNEEARQAMMERRMQGMSPQMRQQHIEMMRQQCQ